MLVRDPSSATLARIDDPLRRKACSSKGNHNFICLLMPTPSGVTDSVVFHELCHRKETNYSGRSYRQVLRVFLDCRIWYNCLKESGEALMRRMMR